MSDQLPKPIPAEADRRRPPVQRLRIEPTGAGAGLTVAEAGQAAILRLVAYRSLCNQDEADQRAAARELSLAITEIESGVQRFNRAYAMLGQGYHPADLEAIDLADTDARTAQSPPTVAGETFGRGPGG